MIKLTPLAGRRALFESVEVDRKPRELTTALKQMWKTATMLQVAEADLPNGPHDFAASEPTGGKRPQCGSKWNTPDHPLNLLL